MESMAKDEEFECRVEALMNIGVREKPVYPGNKSSGLQVHKGNAYTCTQKEVFEHYVCEEDKPYSITFYRLKSGQGWIHDFNPANPSEKSLKLVDEQLQKINSQA